jgi:hypothetical protein
VRARHRLAIGALALAVLSADVAGAAVVGRRLAQRDQPTPAAQHQAGHRAEGRDRAAEPPASPAPNQQARRTATTREIRALLHARARAVLAHDRPAFLATIDPRSRAFRREQDALLHNVAELPLASWSYSYEAGRTATSTSPDRSQVRAAALRADATRRTVTVVFGYRLRGHDQVLLRSEERFVVVRRSGRWLLAGEKPHGPRQLWDYGPVHVLRGRRSLVLGLSPASDLQRYAQDADAAVPAVSKVWGTHWSRDVVVEVPDTETQMTRLLGHPTGTYSQIAAVTTGWADPERGRSSNRIVVNPTAFARLGYLGRRVIITHETVHVASRLVTGEKTPLWLSEGLADYVAYRKADLASSVIAPELMARVHAGKLPSHFAGAQAFAASSKVLARSYESSWLAVRMIAERYGRARLLRFYQQVGAHGLQIACIEVLRIHEPQLVADWRDYLRRLAQ